ncbi:putative nwd2 protein [Mycena sanguinolenta]|uniref:Putative nwd2 protein n=1 Tax=Mycena sanguinolenta TaxID=230812 RepID=A0A8H7DMV0_9AGAR|nr:putative nwd2 protein [Mycena sanguinolenta]
MSVQKMNNHFVGGTGGAGGESHGNGMGGRGGEGIGASLNCDIRVRDGNFIMNNAYHHGSRGIEILHRTVALEAIHDSTDSFMEPKCHPETRTEMLKDLSDWAGDTHPKTTTLWLYGPAGAGKSAIMRTLATQLHEDGRLGGCFFFKRGHATRGNAKTLFTTIAYQLALNVESLWTPISKVVEKNPSIVARSMATQMQELISKPCCAHEHHDPIVILIDGLDECDGYGVQGEILRTIRNASSNHPILLRFIVASRPEPEISKMFPLPDHSRNYRRFNVEQSFDDVRKYLREEFSRIHRDHSTMAHIPSPWPEPNVLGELVRKSSGYFIYASTIIKFIDDENYRPTHRLAMVQNVKSTGSESPFEALDQLYMTILSSAPRQSEVTPILCAIVNFELCSKEIDRLFRLTEGETCLCLRGLHSLLAVPSNDENDKISFHHASFLDFLDNPGRSQTFCVSTFHNRIDLARIVLEACVGPHENTDGFLSRFFRHKLIDFIESLPPSAEVTELLPPIGAVDPEFIFVVFPTNVPKRILAWLKKEPSAPGNLIKLWEDYDCMASLEKMVGWDLPVCPSAKPIFPCSPECLRILISLVVFPRTGLSTLRGRLDLTWPEMRTAICDPSSTVARDQHGRPVLAVRLAFRDVALQYIHKMMKNQLDMRGPVYAWESRDAKFEAIRRREINDTAEKEQIEQRELAFGISYLVRLSPPCPILHQELWSIPIVPDPDWQSSWSRSSLIHHVSKWLESLPVPAMELIAFWKQADKFDLNLLDFRRLNDAEKEWRNRVNKWNQTIVRLDLFSDLKLPIH